MDRRKGLYKVKGGGGIGDEEVWDGGSVCLGMGGMGWISVGGCIVVVLRIGRYRVFEGKRVRVCWE